MKIKYQKAKNKNDAYELACLEITEDYINKFKIKAEIFYEKKEGVIRAEGKGFTLTLSFGEVEVIVDLKLSFLLKPLRGKILGTVESKIKIII